MRRGIYCRQYTQTKPTANYFSFQECLSIRVSMDQVIAPLSQAIMVSCLTLCSKLCQNCDPKNAKSSHKIPIKAKLAYHLLASPDKSIIIDIVIQWLFMDYDTHDTLQFIGKYNPQTNHQHTLALQTDSMIPL